MSEERSGEDGHGRDDTDLDRRVRARSRRDLDVQVMKGEFVALMGPSSMICRGLASRAGRRSGPSQGRRAPGMRRLDTENPVNPALGLAPVPVAPSSLISPPLPVAAVP